MIDRVVRDIRYAVRTSVRAPGFTLLLLLTMAIGIGANTAIFSVVHAVLLAPLPYHDSAGLVVIAQNEGSIDLASAPANIADWQPRSHTLESVAALRNAPLAFSVDGHPERVRGAITTTNFFDVLGIRPRLGRGFLPGDAGKPGARVAVLSERFWRRRLAADPNVIGRRLRLEGETVTVVGVMPPDVDYPDGSELWLSPRWSMPEHPLAPEVDSATMRDRNYLAAVGRLKPGVTIAQARSDLSAVGAQLVREYPDANAGEVLVIAPLRDDIVGPVRPTLLLLLAGVAFLLLVAAANVSGLLLARASSRQQEIAIRVALGAAPRRIVAQLLTESTLVACAGGALGVLLALWLVGPLAALAPQGVLTETAARLDPTVLLFCVAVSVLTGIGVGLAPARQLLRVNAREDLKSGGRAIGGAAPMRRVLVVGQVALSIVLLLGAGLLIRSFVRVLQVQPGFNPDGLLTLTLDLPRSRYAAADARTAFWSRALDALETIPGAAAVGASSRIPLSGGNSGRGFVVEGRPKDSSPEADYRVVTRGYFRAMGIPLLAGRAIDEHDTATSLPTAVISESMARTFWPGIDPIGRRFSIDGSTFISVVGIVGDVHHSSLDRPAQPTMYVPCQQDPWPFMTFVVRVASGSPEAVAGAARQAIWRIDPELSVAGPATMEQRLANSLTRRRFGVSLLSAFGLVALLLVGIGLYGVLAFVVTQRRREIGVRLALGAKASAVVAGVLGEGVRLAAAGLAVGLIVALGLTRFIAGLMYGTSVLDVATFATVSAMIVAVAVFASLIPAMRASRVDPSVALRDN